MSTINLATLMVLLKMDSTKFQEGADGAKTKTLDLKNLVGGALVGALAAATAAAVQFAKESVQEFQTFEKGIKEVYTLLPGISEDAMGQMQDDVLNFDREVGRTSDETIPALYQAISAGVPQGNVFDFMKIASDAALGGVTDLETAVDGITSVVNAYGEETVNAQQASDAMFTAVKLGKTNFEQLSNSLFNVIPTAASLGVSFEDVAANLAALTAQGTPTSVATTQLRQAFVEASKSGSDLDLALRELHGKGFADLIASGMTSSEIFLTLRDSMPEQEFRDLFGSVEASNAVLGITNDTALGIIDTFGGLEGTIGATAAAAETMADSLQHLEEVNTATWEAAKIALGETMGPLKAAYLETSTAIAGDIVVQKELTAAYNDGTLAYGEWLKLSRLSRSGAEGQAEAMAALERATGETGKAFKETGGEIAAYDQKLVNFTAAVESSSAALTYNADLTRDVNRALYEFSGNLGPTTQELEDQAYATGELAGHDEALAAVIDDLNARQEAEAEAARVAAEAQREHQAAMGGYFDAALQAGDGAASLEEQLYASAQAAEAGATELAILAAATGNYTDEEIEAAFQAALMRENIQQLAEAVADGSITANEAVDALKILQTHTADSATEAMNLASGAGEAAAGLDGMSGKAIDAANNLNAIPSEIPVHISITSDPMPTMPSGPDAHKPGGEQHYALGGFTGGSEGDIAGLVHGQEFVFSAPAVRSIGLPVLEMLHNQGLTSGGNSGFSMGDVYVTPGSTDSPIEYGRATQRSITSAARGLGLRR